MVWLDQISIPLEVSFSVNTAVCGWSNHNWTLPHGKLRSPSPHAAPRWHAMHCWPLVSIWSWYQPAEKGSDWSSVQMFCLGYFACGWVNRCQISEIWIRLVQFDVSDFFYTLKEGPFFTEKYTKYFDWHYYNLSGRLHGDRFFWNCTFTKTLSKEKNKKKKRVYTKLY